MKKYVGYRKNSNTGKVLAKFNDDSKDNVMNWLMKEVYNDLGNGWMRAERNSDGSIGSLWRCASEIYDSLSSGVEYSYGDREFWLEEIEVQDTPMYSKGDILRKKTGYPVSICIVDEHDCKYFFFGLTDLDDDFAFIDDIEKEYEKIGTATEKFVDITLPKDEEDE